MGREGERMTFILFWSNRCASRIAAFINADLAFAHGTLEARMLH